MKIADCYNKFSPHIQTLQCPLCSGSFALERPGSLVCENGHCFDLSSKGYVNFVPSRKKDDYSPELFTHRKKIYGLGFYEPVLTATAELIKKHLGDAHIDLLDAGCGEGYYASGLEKIFSGAAIFAADVSANAIKQTDTKSDVLWMVADSARLPLRPQSLNVVLNVLAPANYEQFSRVLAADGILVKLVPGESYLEELRHACAGQLKNDLYSNEDTVSYFGKRFAPLERVRVKYELKPDADALHSFVQMTPMTRHINLETLDLSAIPTVTIDIEILVGKPIREDIR